MYKHMAASIAILGFGTVGSGVYEIIKRNFEAIKKNTGIELRVKYICDIRDFDDHENPELFVRDIGRVLEDDKVKVVVETIGGVGIAYDFVKRALESGKSVVTSNKELVSKHGARLIKTAMEKGVCFLFEASVGGGTPVITPIYRCLAANNIEEIRGIVNGTTNFMLTKMEEEHMDFDAALKEAQNRGYAETIDPSADIDGHDAARKISILASMLYKKAIHAENISTRGIRDISRQDMEAASNLGCVVKLVAWVKAGKMPKIGVEPMLVGKTDMLAHTRDVYNTIEVYGDMLGKAAFYAQGAGSLPTASAVVSDILNALTMGTEIHDSLYWAENPPVEGLYGDDSSYDYYVRFERKNAVLENAESLGGGAFRLRGIRGEKLGEILGAMEEKGFKTAMAMKIVD